MSTTYHKSFDPFGEHTEQRVHIQQTKSWAPPFIFSFFFFPLCQLLSPYFLPFLIPWWHCAMPTGHTLILPLNCDELSSFLSCYNSIPLMLHRVKNLNSALTNLIPQQKSFTIINIFGSWVSFHIFLFHSEGSSGQIPVIYSTPKPKKWLMSSPDCTVHVFLSPSSTELRSLILLQISQITHLGGSMSFLSLHWSSQAMLIHHFMFHSKCIFLLQNYTFKLHFQTRFPEQEHYP